MQDFPEYDSYLQDTGSHDTCENRERGSNRRSGIEPMPEFARTEIVSLEIEVLRETYDEILRAIIENEWEREEGLRTVLLAGLGYLDAKPNLESINRATIAGHEAEATKRVDLMIKELAAYHSMYSVMKFKAFKLYKTNQALEFNISGMREIERTWENWADRMRREHTELQAECIRLRALMSEFKLEWDKPLPEQQSTVPLDQPIMTPFPFPNLPILQVHEEECAPPADEPRPTFLARLRKFLRGGP